MVDTGLTVTAQAECSLSPHLVHLDLEQAFLPITPLDIALIEGRENISPALEPLSNKIMPAFGAPSPALQNASPAPAAP
ncbi:hypothetical protein [Rugamonas rivuli]|uniref:Uncharacterized protein n=1 Tax=Rugamonas rivuli TaxID=2743358 RepID=A0A843SMH7_9BURK|nr:hypothetical protein [Rugamonas rivuli]MQA23403.1 hypothetical protein [Rugamonas rivuli]